MDGDAAASIALDDKYTLDKGRVFISGVQALVRLPIAQRKRDRAAGLNTAGFVSGYRGSPVGGYDAALWRAAAHLQANDILFRSGLNEDLAMAAVWGTQQLDFLPGRKVDGVFAIWYGKGPGVDRSGDALKHANFAGSHPNGGVLVVCGDDHNGKSSSLGHQSDQAMMAANIPLLYPASVQDYLDLGLHGFAISRFSGALTGFKAVNETITATATVEVDPARISTVMPADAPMAPEGVHIRPEYDPQGQDNRVARYKLPRARAYVRANRLDRPVFGAARPRRLGVVSAGKALLDTLAALRLLGIDERAARDLDIGVYKAAMVWPLEPEGLAEFAAQCRELLFVEEKRPVMEDQAKALFYSREPRPRIVGKCDGEGRLLLPSDEPIEAAQAAAAIGARLEAAGALDSARSERLSALRARIGRNLPALSGGVARSAYFCSGCPHNTSTKVPDGSVAMAGIGCHGMALMMPERNTLSLPHMGAEGAPWTGLAPFTETPHVFQNLGDGTYVHSGSLGVRAAVQAGANVTFKILYNDAVAMTGGQPLDGPLTVQGATRQLRAEGVGRIAVVADDPGKYPPGAGFAEDVTIDGREDLDRVQRELRECEGVSTLVYDQTCATEKRRRRKRGLMEDPAWRVVINPDVCEGCGDCGTRSNCLSVVPLETEFGRKRAIDQSSCNKDFSCLEGFCPSFVLVKGGRERRPTAAEPPAGLPEPSLPSCAEPYGILLAGVGGTGIVTLGALLGMAAHLEGKDATVLDKAGLAQKYGAVTSHIRIAEGRGRLHAVRIATGGARLLIGVDPVVAASGEAVARLDRGASRVVLNGDATPTGDFTRDPDLAFPAAQLRRVVEEAAGADAVETVDATRMATALAGDAVAANLFLLGFAWQGGLVPLAAGSLERAIALNGVAVEANLRAFRWGRAACHDPQAASEAAARAGGGPPPALSRTLDEAIARRAEDLAAWQNAAWAGRYRALVERVRAAERALTPGREALTAAVARALHKLMTYKDEYETARLFADGRFRHRLAARFAGPVALRFSLAPPLLARRDPHTGHLRKRLYGGWVLPAFRLLAALKGLRGTAFDPFGHTAERRRERALIGEYEATVEELLAGLDENNHARAVEIAELPLAMRGFGHVKADNVRRAKEREARLLAAFRSPAPVPAE